MVIFHSFLYVYQRVFRFVTIARGHTPWKSNLAQEIPGGKPTSRREVSGWIKHGNQAIWYHVISTTRSIAASYPTRSTAGMRSSLADLWFFRSFGSMPWMGHRQDVKKTRREITNQLGLSFFFFGHFLKFGTPLNYANLVKWSKSDSRSCEPRQYLGILWGIPEIPWKGAPVITCYPCFNIAPTEHRNPRPKWEGAPWPAAKADQNVDVSICRSFGGSDIWYL